MLALTILLGCGTPPPPPPPPPTQEEQGRDWPRFSAFEAKADGCTWMVREPDGTSRRLVTLPVCARAWGLSANQDNALVLLEDGRLVSVRFVNQTFETLPEVLGAPSDLGYGEDGVPRVVARWKGTKTRYLLEQGRWTWESDLGDSLGTALPSQWTRHDPWSAPPYWSASPAPDAPLDPADAVDTGLRKIRWSPPQGAPLAEVAWREGADKKSGRTLYIGPVVVRLPGGTWTSVPGLDEYYLDNVTIHGEWLIAVQEDGDSVLVDLRTGIVAWKGRLAAFWPVKAG